MWVWFVFLFKLFGVFCPDWFSNLGFTRFPSSWANEYLISCTFCLYLFILVLLCYWHCSICCVLFSREALLQDNTLVTKSRRQAAQLLIVLIITFFILILPHKIWAIVQQRLNYKQLIRIGFRRHSLIIICTRSLLYLNSAVCIRLFLEDSEEKSLSLSGTFVLW